MVYQHLKLAFFDHHTVMHVFLKAISPRDFCSLPIPYRYVTYVLQLCMKILDAEGVFNANLQHVELQNILSTTCDM